MKERACKQAEWPHICDISSRGQWQGMALQLGGLGERLTTPKRRKIIEHVTKCENERRTCILAQECKNDIRFWPERLEVTRGWWQLYKEEQNLSCSECDVLTAVVMKSSVFWDITRCSLLKVKRHFGETCHFHLQGRRISSSCYLLNARFLLGLFFDPENEDMFLRNVGWLSGEPISRPRFEPSTSRIHVWIVTSGLTCSVSGQKTGALWATIGFSSRLLFCSVWRVYSTLCCSNLYTRNLSRGYSEPCIYGPTEERTR
jgi:hypothetical protein